MPIYAYKCTACEHQLDVLQKISDPPLTVCPQCGQPALAKQLTAAGFQLKGSGWYVTDFRDGGAKKDGKPAEPKEGAAPAAEAKPAESKSAEAKTAEAKPAASSTPVPTGS